MEGALPHFDFTEFEFHQAGLLRDNSAEPLVIEWPGRAHPVRESSRQGALESRALLSQPQRHTASAEGLDRTELQPGHHRYHASAVTSDLICKRQANREHQKRFRDRHKAKQQAVEIQLAKTTEELAQIKLQQHELQNRLTQAELKTPLDFQPKLPKTGVALPDELVNRPPLTITLPGKQRQLSMQDACNMPAQQSRALWAEYGVELNKCLSNLQQHADSGTEGRLNQLTLEAYKFKCQHVMLKVKGLKPINLGLLAAPGLAKDSAYLMDLLCLSDHQIHDLMFLRRVYLLKRHELKSQCTALTARLQHRDLGSWPLVNVTTVASAATQLQQNAAEDHQVLMRLVWAVLFGVFHMKQTAQMLVNSDPEQPVVADLVEHIAQQSGLATEDELIASVPDGMARSDWKCFWDYAEAVQPDVAPKPHYVPVPRTQQPAISSQLLLY